MSVYYPQAKILLRVLWEDFNDKTNTKLKELNHLPIVARSMDVSINDYTHADTFSIDIDYKSFPFDPRCIRACGVSVFLEDTGSLFNDDRSLNNIIPNDDNAIFLGFTDEESIEFDDEHRTVHMEGRDYTALLIDKKYFGVPIPLTTPLDQLLQGLLNNLPSTVAIKIDNRTGETLPAPASYAPSFSLTDQSKNPKPNETYWEVIQDLVGRAGLICYIELDKLVLTKPRVLYSEKQAKQFIYGRNIKSIKFKRKLGRMKGLNIRCISFDFVNKFTQQAKIPLEAEAAWAKSIGVEQAESSVPKMKSDGTVDKDNEEVAPYLGFKFPNMTKKQLIQVGQKIYEELSRQQIEGEFTTKDMETVDGSGNLFDVTKLRIGTPIHIHIDQGDLHGIEKLATVAERQRFLISHSYDSKVAAALAEVLGKFKLLFYTKNVRLNMQQDSGFSCTVEFINFIEITDRGLSGNA